MEQADFKARFKRALSSLEKKVPPILEYDENSSLPVTLGVETTPPKEDSTAKLAKVTSINLFQQPEAHPVVIDLALLKTYGPEWLRWEMDTLIWTIPQDFKTSGVSELTVEKIQALKALHYNDNFWKQWEVFNWCLQPFNNLYADFDILQVPSTAQIMVAVNTSLAIRTDVEWSREVRDFMAISCRHDGIFCPPAPIDFLEVDAKNGFIDKEEINKRWPKVLSTGIAPTEDSITAEQLRRMLSAHDFLQANKVRLHEQLRLVADGP